MTPFRSEKNTNWEGAFRVPELIRWPGKIAAGMVSNEIVQHHDWLPTFLAAAGEPDIVEKLKAGHQIGDTTFKVAHRRLQPGPVPDRRGGQEPAAGARLLLRRRRRARAPLRQLEGRLHGAAGAGDAADLGRAVRGAARPEAVQPAHRPVRARRRDLEHLLRLVPRQRLHRAGRNGGRDPVPRDVQGVPATAGGAELHDRPGGREARGGARGRAAEHGRAACILERRRRPSDAMLEFVERCGRRRAARGARRGLRQRRHALVREADADSGGLHRAPAARDGGGRPGAPREAAVAGGVRAGLRLVRNGAGGALRRQRHQRANAPRRV